MTKQKNLNEQASFSAPIEDLQVRITFLDDLVEQLNEQVSRQSVEIADLKKQMQFLYQRIESADLSDGIATFDPLADRPPHY
ncbi:MAG: SlyX family protein [Acinetobacter sp.]|mgnify:CR=1 FL=1|jgi:SlyX protein|uniref:SlyX protein n=1 Tax=Acinetobacter albensis TaxID=1673609 RepID=A0A1C4GTY4_9GAMM|nr:MULTISPECIES: SlyX family protein [Acinetobacter]ALD01958.1 SlyX protein [Acinetobacter sp. TTH0-4]MBE9400212.1 SlyX family protein [Acinetobacter albensis]QPF37622.1 SlyX family protein [Acinetobacter sp. TTH0-4]SCC71315.1 SlyX protein [Acinetobacter albensis]